MSLIGPPEVGKSRLALEAARAVEHAFAGGVWFVELARAGRPADAARVVARTLDARGPAPSRDPLARVVQRLGQANVLLILDGCEPVIEEAARVAAISVGSARTHYHRGKARLRQLMGER